ncbi:MAG: hypothetical protein IIC73_01110, partial [Armatimonadetes bacterium]|nr:hypothetical protein [Armatimonadota bacterium]
MRSGIAQVKTVENARVIFDKELARLKFDARKVTLQELIQAVKGASERFDAKLLLQLQNPKAPADAVKRARQAIAKVKGVKSVGNPDKSNNIAVTFDLKERTMLADVLKAAKDAGVALRDPKE